MTNEATPYWDPADALTAYCEGAVLGKRFVAISGPLSSGLPQIGQAGGATTGITPRVLGVAEQDAAATETVTVATEGVWPLTAGGTVAAGDPVTYDSVGRAIKATGTTGNPVAKHGYALDDATIGVDVPVKLELNTAFVAP